MANLEKLQWKVKHLNNFNEEKDFLNTILIENGIKEQDIKLFLSPSRKSLNNPFLMKNMEEAVNLVHNIIKKEAPKIFVKVDCDTDGFSSGSVIIQFLKNLNQNLEIVWKTNYDKIHGLYYNDIKKYKKDYFDLIIVPDASMSCEEARLITRNFKAKILVLDHHLVETQFLNKENNQWLDKNQAEELMKQGNFKIEEDVYTNYCLSLNCHDGTYPNPNLSGVGVVQKFIEAYLIKYEEEDDLEESLNEYFYDLVSLGMIADAIEAKNPETRYYMLEGLKSFNYHNDLINELVERNKDEFKFGRTIKNSGWVLGPRINAVIRYGKNIEQDNLFRAIMAEEETIEYQPRRKSKNDPKPDIELHTLQWDMARVCDNVKQRQDTEVRKFMKDIEEEIYKKDLLKNSVLFVDGTKVLTKGTVTGLIANKLASKYYRPVVLMREKDSDFFGGSARGYDKGNIKDLNEFLSNVGITCMGHSNAFGVSFKKEDTQNIINACNKLLPVDELCTIHTVDWEIPATDLKKEYVQEVAENFEVFGNGVDEPLFAITDLEINASQINGYGDNYGFIRFIYNGITFVKKYCPIGDYNNMTLRDRGVFGVNKKQLRLNLICQFVLNSWEDKINPEVKILYYDVEEIKDNIINNKKNNSNFNPSNEDDNLLGEGIKNVSRSQNIIKNISGIKNDKSNNKKIFSLEDEDFIF